MSTGDRFAIACAVVALIIAAAWVLYEPPAQRTTPELVYCAGTRCRGAMSSESPQAGEDVFVPESWLRDVERSRDSLRAVLARCQHIVALWGSSIR